MTRKTNRVQKTSPPAPFDKLRRDHDYGGYSTKVAIDGRTVWVRFDAESREALQALLPTATKFWRSRTRWFKAFQEYAVSELLPTLNGFLDCGEEEPSVVTANQLRRILKVPFTVEFRRDEVRGDVYFVLSGGDDAALHEHCFEVIGSLTAGITEGDVASLL